jgi:hypothetical protein
MPSSSEELDNVVGTLGKYVEKMEQKEEKQSLNPAETQATAKLDAVRSQLVALIPRLKAALPKYNELGDELNRVQKLLIDSGNVQASPKEFVPKYNISLPAYLKLQKSIDALNEGEYASVPENPAIVNSIKQLRDEVSKLTNQDIRQQFAELGKSIKIVIKFQNELIGIKNNISSTFDVAKKDMLSQTALRDKYKRDSLELLEREQKQVNDPNHPDNQGNQGNQNNRPPQSPALFNRQSSANAHSQAQQAAGQQQGNQPVRPPAGREGK